MEDGGMEDGGPRRWMEDGGWRDGGWTMEDGRWRMEDDGGWRMEDGGWRMESSRRFHGFTGISEALKAISLGEG